MPKPNQTMTNPAPPPLVEPPVATSTSEQSESHIKCEIITAGDGRKLYRYQTPGEPAIICPKPLEEMTEQDFYDLPPALYDNQPGRLPANLVVEFKDPQWAGHWFNKSAGGGARVSVGLTLGFIPAKKEDLKFYFKGLNDKDGAVEMHDLVLMKIPKFKLYMSCARYINMAKERGGVKGYQNQAPQGLTPSQQEHIDYFLTPQAEGEQQGLGPVVHYAQIPVDKSKSQSARR